MYRPFNIYTLSSFVLPIPLFHTTKYPFCTRMNMVDDHSLTSDATWCHQYICCVYIYLSWSFLNNKYLNLSKTVRVPTQTVKLYNRVKYGDLSDILEPHMTCYDIMYYLNTVLEQLSKCFYTILVRIVNAFIATMRVTNTSLSIIQYDSWSCPLWILIGQLYNVAWVSYYLCS